MILRLMSFAVLMSAIPLGPVMAGDTEVSIDSGKTPLHGAYRMPVGFERGPALLMIAGSGPTDRNSDSTIAGVRPGSFRLLADELERQGIPSLRFDKRGTGASVAAAPPEADLRFDDLVADAVNWAEYLRKQPGVTCVVIFGHSEGALIGAIVASRVPVCGIVEASGAGRPMDAVVEAQLAASGASPEVQAKVRETLEALKLGKTVETPPGLAALFRPSVQPYLISVLKYDPAETIKAAKAPVLIVQGDNDLQVSVTDARLLAAARPDAKLLIVPGMNHILKIAPTDRAGNIATYADPTRQLAPTLVPAVTAFVRSVQPKR